MRLDVDEREMTSACLCSGWGLVFKSEMCLHLDFTFLSVSNILSNALAVERILVALSKTHLTRHFPHCMIAIDKRTLLSFIMAQHMGPCIEQHVYDAFDNEKVNPCIGDASIVRSCTCAVVLQYSKQQGVAMHVRCSFQISESFQFRFSEVRGSNTHAITKHDLSHEASDSFHSMIWQ